MTAIRRVEVREVTKRFGSTMALRAVSAEFDSGVVNLIVGPNGSGKTTLLGVVGTTIRPSSGSVTYRPIGEASVEVRAEMGWLSHETLAYADLSGRRNIEIAAAAHGVDLDKAWARSVERFELGAFSDRPLRTNSRGQRQRIALAKALVHEPSLILLDEPTTGLDAKGVERLMRVVGEELDRGSVVVVVAHDLEAFQGFPCKILQLDRGSVVV